MSWDISLVKTITNSEDYDSIGDDDRIAIASPYAAEILKAEFTELDCSDPNWFVYNTVDFGAEISFSNEKEVSVYIHADDRLLAFDFIKKLCELFDCRAFDWEQAEFLSDEPILINAPPTNGLKIKKESIFKRLFGKKK